MEYLFEAVNNYVAEEIKALTRFHFGKVQRRQKYTFIGGGIFFLAVGVFQLVNFPGPAGVVYLALAALLIGLWVYLYSGRPSIKKNINPAFGIITNRFRFGQDSMEYANQQSQGFYYYHQLHFVYETQSRFFLYINKANCFLIRKDGFTLGDPAGFRQFISYKMGPKYKYINTP